jgi:hypothetical protein
LLNKSRYFIYTFSYICSTILGSLISFKEISNDEIQSDFGITLEDLLNFQKLVIKLYSTKFLKREFTLEMMRYMSEPYKNVIIIDLLENLVKNYKSILFTPDEIITYDKIIEIIGTISEMNYN